MNEETISVLEEVFTDIKVEAAAVRLALQQKDVSSEMIDSLRSEVDAKAIRDGVREKLLPALFS